jgi:uridine monophosphate synthetase
MIHFARRASLTHNPTAKRLFLLMEDKQTNLAVAADLTHAQDILDLANAVGPYICLLKTHIDIVEDFSPAFVADLQSLAKKHNFLIFEDRKFADIGNTALHQYRDGMYCIAQWADIINAHIVPGPGVIDGLKKIGLPLGRGLLLIAQMSSKENMATDAYTRQAVAWAREHQDFVIGFIGHGDILPDDSPFVTMMPGVKIHGGTDELKQAYQTPHDVIAKKKTDIFIVGRGIYTAHDPVKTTKLYRDAGWEAYLETTSKDVF